MKRARQSEGRGTDQRFAREALAELRKVWKSERAIKRPRARHASNLMRLAAETRELLAMWTYYRLACLEALESTHMGAA
jgi:hypothetical protein